MRAIFPMYDTPFQFLVLEERLAFLRLYAPALARTYPSAAEIPVGCDRETSADMALPLRDTSRAKRGAGGSLFAPWRSGRSLMKCRIGYPPMQIRVSMAHWSIHRMLGGSRQEFGVMRTPGPRDLRCRCASVPGVQAEEGRESYASRRTPHVTGVTRHAQSAKPTSGCRTLHHGTPPRWERVLHPETTMKASPYRHNWLLSGAPAPCCTTRNFKCLAGAGWGPGGC
jgi:hypothetical protein